MEIPQKFKEAFAELSGEVDKLLHNSESLKQECATLTARKNHLQSEVDSAKSRHDQQKNQLEAEISTLRQQVQGLENTRKNHTDDIGELLKKKSIITSTLQTMQESTDKQVAEFDALIESKKAEMSGIENVIRNKEAEADKVQGTINTLNRQLQVRQQQAADADIEHAARMAEIDKSIEDHKAEADNLQPAIDDKRDELEELTQKCEESRLRVQEDSKKHMQFVEYERQAKSKLQVREDALVAKEREFNNRQILARRRQNVI